MRLACLCVPKCGEGGCDDDAPDLIAYDWDDDDDDDDWGWRVKAKLYKEEVLSASKKSKELLDDDGLSWRPSEISFDREDGDDEVRVYIYYPI